MVTCSNWGLVLVSQMNVCRKTLAEKFGLKSETLIEERILRLESPKYVLLVGLSILG